MRITGILLLALLLSGCDQAEDATTEPGEAFEDTFGETIGIVHLETSCNQAAGVLIDRATGLMHHMRYDFAREVYREARAADPECAMAIWGEAMTWIHPLWPDRPGADAVATGASLAAEAIAAGPPTEREQAFTRTAAAYFEGPYGTSEAERLNAFYEAWSELREGWPDDVEIRAFHALALLATADPGDDSLSVQREAGAEVEAVLAENPDHPGAHHYIIHSYDVPGLADRALEVSHAYAENAPMVSHALHMPTHIFTRLGQWQDSIELNLRSAEAALAETSETGLLATAYPHALDYAAYAYLQVAHDAEAEGIVDIIEAMTGPYSPQNPDAHGYAMAAIPARMALERQDWERAAALTVGVPDDFPWWDDVPQYQAMTYFARALGAARLGDEAGAEAGIAELARIEAIVAERNTYWAGQIAIQRTAAEAWLAWAREERGDALALMQESARLESETEKSPVTPGEILPARELLADMLLAAGDFDAALEAYRMTLERSPGRFNSLFGAARAAEGLGDDELARSWYLALVEMCGDEATGTARLAAAREALN